MAAMLCLLFGGTPSFANTQTGADAQSASPATSQEAGSAPQKDTNQTSADIPVPLPKGKKLILTNGTFQMVREYHREGDRVRYYSVERSAWEEIPAALVDWDATGKAEAGQQQKDKQLAAKIAATEKAERVGDLDVDNSFEVRPGLILPDGQGLYAIDGKKIVSMAQDTAATRLNKGRTVARIVTGIPMIAQKQEMEIPGKAARIRIQTNDPEFYFRTADGREPQLSLVRADVKDGKRELEAIKTDMVGQVKYEDHEISLLEWDAAQGLYRFTVDQPLEPGEYALVESTPDGPDLYVWDFGVSAAPGGNTASSDSSETKSGKSKNR